jgi:single-stranded-DNA-specific exonuclease
MALLVQFFRLAHFQVEPPFAPNRVSEGYGLNMNAIEDIAKRGVRLLITVDCGINDVEELHRARELGIDVIIVDHHEHSGERPPATAILNPKVDGSTYPFRELAAVGVTFKLIQALAERFSPSVKLSPEFRQFFDEALGLVALGSVSDVVPLVGENRILVYHGLKMLSRSQSPGLSALMDVASVPHDKIDTWHIAYQLGPRINVAGRLKEAQVAVELLTTDNSQRAWEIAKELDKENRNRQKIEREIFESAVEKLKGLDLNDKNIVIVLSDEAWHPGVIGIVAARLVEEYHRPAVLIALEGDKGRGSARSIPAYHIHEALTACEDKLLAFGGHSFAAGIEILKSEIESFNLALCKDAREKLTDEDLIPKLHIDAELKFADINELLLGEIRRLAPHGRGNPTPLFWASGVNVAGRPQQVGTRGNHLSLFLSQGGTAFRGIAFGKGHLIKELEDHKENLDVAFRPRVSQYSGRMELDIKDIRIPDSP